MKTASLAVAAAAASLTAATAAAGLQTFEFTLDGMQEVPSNDSDATGMATFNYDPDMKTFDFDLTVSGLELTDLMDVGPNSTPIHIHLAPAGQNGGIVIDLGFFADFVQDGPDISFSLTDTPLGGTQGAVNSDPQTVEDALFAGNLYVNIHTTSFGGGEIRGQVIPAAPAAALFAVAGLAATRRRRR